MMRTAIKLAQRTAQPPSPNPPVGALVVDDQGKILGQGTHQGAGTPHAERIALDEAGPLAAGATLIVTLAPCSSHGRTGPCLDAVLASGVSRVVVGVEDPDPREAPGSIPSMESAGIEVITGVGESAARALIAGFTTRVTKGRPRITLKLATSLDGRVAAADRSSRWVTGPGARRDAHRLRAMSDAVLVGAGTVRDDDPSLTVRLRGHGGYQPLRIVLDGSGKIDVAAKVFDGAAPLLMATTAKVDRDRQSAWRAAGAEVVELPNQDGRVDLRALATELGRRGANELLVEGGPTVAGALIEQGLVDRFVIYLAPKLLGSQGLPSIDGLLIGSIDRAVELTFTSVRRVGADLRLEGQLRI